MRTAKEIREGLKGEGRVYIWKVFADRAIRVTDARTRKGELQVKLLSHDPELGGTWYTVSIGDEIWGTP